MIAKEIRQGGTTKNGTSNWSPNDHEVSVMTLMTGV